MTQRIGSLPRSRRTRWQRFCAALSQGKMVYLMFLPVAIYYLIFSYYPMYGIIIAFKDYVPGMTYAEAPWVGFKHFIAFFESPLFVKTVRNTILLNLWELAFGFSAPIIFALLLNELRLRWFKRTVQTITYLPHFVALVVIVAMVKDVLSSEGLFNQLYKMWWVNVQHLPAQDFKPIMYLTNPDYFRPIYTFSGIYQSFGYGSIIYLSAIAGIDPQLYEVVAIDGGGRLRKMWHVTLPGIAPTIVMLLIFAVGGIMASGFEKIQLLYQPATYETADVVATYLYRKGLEESQFSFSTAISLFNTTINFLLLISVNWIARRVSEYSLW